MYETITQELLGFIKASPSCYHVVANMRAILAENGYIELNEGSLWTLNGGEKYFVVRNESSLIAFQLPRMDFCGFQIAATHSDAPALKLKENAEMTVNDQYVTLNVEKYGGMLCAPWFDRPLSVTGRVIVRDGDRFTTRLVYVDRDLLMLPSLAIHMDRTVNEGHAYNAQKDMLPLFGDEKAKGRLLPIIAKAAGVDEGDILGSDLFLCDRTEGTVWGANREYVSAGRLDDLMCAYASLRGFLDANNAKSVPVFAIFDNEEVGSGTKQGAASTFLRDTLMRVNGCCGRTNEAYRAAIACSFMASADNAHALHPNFVEKADPINRPCMNKGVVIKYNANQRYTTDAVSAAIFKQICARANVPWQSFTNRSDVAGGSTLGNISNAKVSLNTVDIGLAQLAMHAPYETAGALDSAYLASALRVLFGASLTDTGYGSYTLQMDE